MDEIGEKLWYGWRRGILCGVSVAPTSRGRILFTAEKFGIRIRYSMIKRADEVVKKVMRFGLREKLLIPAVLAIALGIFLTVGFSYLGVTKEIEHQVKSALEREVALSVRLMDNWIEARKTDLRTWSGQEMYVASLTQEGYDGESAREGASRALAGLVRGYPCYDGLVLIDSRGDLSASSSTEDTSGITLGDREYFKRSMEGNIHVSDIITSRKSGEKVFVVSVPVKEEKEVRGVLAGVVRLSFFSSLFVEGLSLGRDGHAFISDRKGGVLTISGRDAQGVTHIGGYRFGEEILERKIGTMIHGHGGVKRICCFRELSFSGWRFVETLSLDEAFATARSVGRYSIALGLGILVAVSLVLSLLFHRMIHLRLGEMLKVMGRVERGNLDVRIQGRGNVDEIGVLTEAFNTMITRLSATLDDLTGEIRVRKRAEAALDSHRHNLEEIVRERTLELEREIAVRSRTEKTKKSLEERLLRAEKMEAVGTLAGGVAHDLNNILSGIVTYPEFLLMGLPEGSPMKKPIETMRESGIKAAAIVQDLLTMTRRGVAVTKVVNLNPVISEYLESPEFEKLISFHPHVAVETNLHKELMNIMGAPVHLSKTVMNLVANAAESMPHGGKISIHTRNLYVDRAIRGYDKVEEGDYALLTISDTGVGISPEDRMRVFEPFYTKKKMGRSGTGLGMAVVWGTVKDHRGYIDLESTQGKGTKFTLYFPVTRKKREEVSSGSLWDDYLGEGETILVVDDAAVQREIATTILSALGYSADSVATGEEAVEYVGKKPVDLLMLDMVMDRGMDGLDTYKKIIERCPGQKVIIASGFSETRRVKEVLEMSGGKYIKKPYDIEAIGAAVKQQLKGR